MDYFSKNKIFVGAIVILVVINAVSLGTLWWFAGRQQNPPPPFPGPPGAAGPKEFMERELRFSTEQKRQFEELRLEHQRTMRPILEELRESKKQLFALLHTPDVADSAVSRKAGDIGRLQSSLEVKTFRHFQKIRAMCTPRQQLRFDEIMEEVRQVLGGQPPPQGAPSRPETGGPPPPQGESE